MSYQRIFAVLLLVFLHSSCAKKTFNGNQNFQNNPSKPEKKNDMPTEKIVQSEIGLDSVESNCQVAISRSLKRVREDSELITFLQLVQSGLENTTISHFIGDDGAVLIKGDQVNIKYGDETKKTLVDRSLFYSNITKYACRGYK